MCHFWRGLENILRKRDGVPGLRTAEMLLAEEEGASFEVCMPSFSPLLAKEP